MRDMDDSLHAVQRRLERERIRWTDNGARPVSAAEVQSEVQSARATELATRRSTAAALAAAAKAAGQGSGGGHRQGQGACGRIVRVAAVDEQRGPGKLTQGRR
jgi:hypothetical protein